MTDFFSSPSEKNSNTGGQQHPKQPETKIIAPKKAKLSRISKTGQNILAQAERSLSQSSRPRKKTQETNTLPPSLQKPLYPALTSTLVADESSLLVEVTDNFDNPLMCMMPELALKQKLHFRLAIVALRSKQNTLFLYKRNIPSLPHQGKWDLYTGPVFAGESREDAALRLLQNSAFVGTLPLTEAVVQPATNEQTLHTTLFTAELPVGLYPAHTQLCVDSDELFGLLQQEPELFTPELIWAASTAALFRPERKRKRPENSQLSKPRLSS